jgi:hypothetical protein
MPGAATPCVFCKPLTVCGFFVELSTSRPTTDRHRRFCPPAASLILHAIGRCPGAFPATVLGAGASDNLGKKPAGVWCKGKKQMTMPIRFLAASLRPTPVEAPPASSADLIDELVANGRRLRDRLRASWSIVAPSAAPLAFARYLIAFFIGAAVTMAWQSRVSPAGAVIAAAAAPPDQQQLNAMLLDSMRQGIDRLATHVASVEEQMTHGLDQIGAGQEQLAAGYEQMTRDMAKLQAALSRTTEPAPRPAPAPTPGFTTTHRSSQPAPTEADIRSDWRRQPCCQWPASSSR